MPRLVNGLEQIFTQLGIVGSGYKLYFFEVGTDTPKTTYSDEDLTIANTNPVEMDSAGRPESDIWGSDPSLYRMALGDPDSTIDDVLENPIVDADPIDNYSVNNVANFDPIPATFWGTTTGTSTAYVLNPALVSITSYSDSQTFLISFHIACGDSPTLSVNGLEALDLKKYMGDGTKTVLIENDVLNQTYLARNDGTDIIILNPEYISVVNANKLTTPSQGTLTISSGVITVEGSDYLIDTESSASTDDLDTINGGSDGMRLFVGSVDSSRNVILKHNTGNIYNIAGCDIVLDTTNDKVELIYDSTLSKWMVISSKSLSPIMVVSEQQANGVTSSCSTATGLTTLVLNTVEFNSISGASLSSNQITLPAGTYKITGTHARYGITNGHKMILHNVSDSSNIIIGRNGAGADGIGVFSETCLGGVFTIGASKILSITFFQNANGSFVAVSAGTVEVYTRIIIEKIG